MDTCTLKRQITSLEKVLSVREHENYKIKSTIKELREALLKAHQKEINNASKKK